MSKATSVASSIVRDLRSAGHESSITGRMGDTVLIGVKNSAIDVAVYRSQGGELSVKLGHADKFEPVHMDDIIEKVNRIQKPTR